jgi:glycosyltransferase involved in cell wall biosynthesis
VRILFLSNFFPPLHRGGYEELAADVAEALRARGHRIDVLTSNWRAPGGADPVVHRVLELEVDLRPWRGTLGFFAGRRRRAENDAARLRDAIAAMRPDVLLAWGMWNLPRTLLVHAESQRRPPVVYYVADYWPALRDAYAMHWQAPATHRWARLPKAVLARAIYQLHRSPPPPALAFRHAICVSHAVRARLIEAGLPFQDARVIHNGIDLRRFPFRPHPRQPAAGAIAIGYIGRMTPEKGVDTLLAALAVLVRRGQAVHLTLAGAADRSRAAALRRRIERLGLSDCVTLCGFVPRDRVPPLLGEVDVLVVPSLWPEPLARSIQEGMATGAAVVATPVGGTVEIVEEGVNGLFFPPADAAALAERIERLQRDPALRASLAAAARRTVEERFDLARTVDALEDVLRHAASAANATNLAVEAG